MPSHFFPIDFNFYLCLLLLQLIFNSIAYAIGETNDNKKCAIVSNSMRLISIRKKRYISCIPNEFVIVIIAGFKFYRIPFGSCHFSFISFDSCSNNVAAAATAGFVIVVGAVVVSFPYC